MNYTKEQIKEILNDPLLLDINLNKNFYYVDNKNILLKFIEKYKIFNKDEAKYLIKNKNNIDNIHIFCKICGNKSNYSKSIGKYRTYCCRSCMYKDKERLYKIGLKNKQNAKIALIKRNNTKILKYGDPNYNNKEKIKQTKLNNIDENGLNSFQRALQKGRQTNLIKYGVDNPFKSKDVKLNGKLTINKKYGTNSYTQTKEYKQYMQDNKDIINNKRKKTNKIERGVDYYFQSKEFKNNLKNHLQEKFNADCYTKSQDYQNKKYLIKQKEHDTKKKNGIFGKRSKAEIYCFELLKTKFSDAEHSYMNYKKYPFNCDAYIPSKDLFIEFHFSQYHHFEPFNQNNIGHLSELSRIRYIINNPFYTENYKKEYKEILKTWTNSDILKLQTFKNNNLNYKIFYTKKQFMDWFNNI